AAAEALELIDVDYTPLPAVVPLEEALAPGAALVHTGQPLAGHFADLATLRPEPGTNVCHRFRYARGHAETALAEAHLVLEDTFRFPRVQHYAMEPNAALAAWDETGALTVWASTQNPYSVRVELAKMFAVPLARIRIVVPHLGRGFGVPQLAWALESLMDVAADRLGRDPVDLRRQNLLAHGEEFAPGDTPIDGKLEESLGRAATAIRWTTQRDAGSARGVAAMLK